MSKCRKTFASVCRVAGTVLGSEQWRWEMALSTGLSRRWGTKGGQAPTTPAGRVRCGQDTVWCAGCPSSCDRSVPCVLGSFYTCCFPCTFSESRSKCSQGQSRRLISSHFLSGTQFPRALCSLLLWAGGSLCQSLRSAPDVPSLSSLGFSPELSSMFVVAPVFVLLDWLRHFGGAHRLEFSHFKKVIQLLWAGWGPPSTFPSSPSSWRRLHLHPSSCFRCLVTSSSLLCSHFGGGLSPVAFWDKMLKR